jgi:hypothetical protein
VAAFSIKSGAKIFALVGLWRSGGRAPNGAPQLAVAGAVPHDDIVFIPLTVRRWLDLRAFSDDSLPP